MLRRDLGLSEGWLMDAQAAHLFAENSSAPSCSERQEGAAEEREGRAETSASFGATTALKINHILLVKKITKTICRFVFFYLK